MATVSELALHITAKSDAKAILDDTTKSASGFTSAVKGIGAAVGASAITGGLKSMTQSLSGFTQAAADDAASSGRLQQAIKNTGADFGTYAKQIEGVISVGQKLGFTDDQTRDSLSLLAAQTGSTEEAVKRYALAQDLARGANIDVVTASRLLGKVTDENVNVLARYGIKVAEGASETELFGAIAQKFGGQAKEFGDSTAGAASRAAIGMDEMRESMGSKLLPVMAQGLSLFQAMPGPLQVGAAAFLSFGPAAAQMTTGLMAVIPALSALGPAMRAASTAIKAMGMAMLTPPLGIVIALVAVGVAAYVFRDQIMDAFGAAADFVLPIVASISDAVVGAFNAVVQTISGAGSAVVAEVTASWNHLKQVVSAAGSAILTEVAASWNHLVQVVSSAGQAVLTEITASWDHARQITSDAWAAVSQAVSDGWNAITGVVSAGVSAVLSLLEDLVGRYIQGWQIILSTVTGIASEIYSAVAGTFSEIVGVVSRTMNEVVGTIAGLAGEALNAARTLGANVYLGIKGEIEDLPGVLYEIAKGIPSSLWEGIQATAGNLYGKVRNFAENIANEAKKGLGDLLPGSPSKLGLEIPLAIAEGIAQNGFFAVRAVDELGQEMARVAEQNSNLLVEKLEDGSKQIRAVISQDIEAMRAALRSAEQMGYNVPAAARSTLGAMLGHSAPDLRGTNIPSGAQHPGGELIDLREASPAEREMAAALYNARQMGYTLPPGFQHGTSYVPRTGLAMLHQGEAVIPAGQNRGGLTINVNVAGSIRSDRDIAQIIRDELLRGGFYGLVARPA